MMDTTQLTRAIQFLGMTTSTAAISLTQMFRALVAVPRESAALLSRRASGALARRRYGLALVVLSLGLPAGATTVIGPWVPKFKGLDYSVSTNTPSAEFPNHHVVHALRVDLADPDIRLHTTPRISDYVAN